MNIGDATRDYEAWLARCTTIVPTHLRKKHEQMREDPFAFLRGTYYRWAQTWPERCPALRRAPRVLGIGDLHLDSFGTWRDAEGRLCWGVSDFDEAHTLPYTADLLRLAASARIAIDIDQLSLKFKSACDLIVDGYRRTLRDGGRPLVLGERNVTLERLGIKAIEAPEQFWPTVTSLPSARKPVPKDARRALESALPDASIAYRIATREAGIGSLGQQRFVAIATWEGGPIAREAKAMAPPAHFWLRGRVRRGQPFYGRILHHAVRSPDPFQSIVGTWVVRRLSPDANQIATADLTDTRDEEVLLRTMGAETANVHLGTRGQAKRILADLHRRKADWLRDSAKTMVDATEHDWKVFRKRSR